NITVSAGEVKDNSLTATILGDPTPDLIVAFDNKQVENGIGGVYGEDLKFGFTVEVVGDENVLKGIKFDFTLDSNFEALFTNNYLKFIANGTSSIAKTFSMNKGATCTMSDNSISFADTTYSKVTYSYAGGKGTFVCQFAFTWGSVFGGKNPSEYYATQTTSETKASVINNLKAFDKEAKKVTASPWMSVVVTPVATA
ncbi:MAG: hypothetical protein SPF22_02690, partial [Candidatus Onthovivens sp.]|nr:hypothetical protein [Candidatus Onthovivens sp.]